MSSRLPGVKDEDVIISPPRLIREDGSDPNKPNIIGILLWSGYILGCIIVLTGLILLMKKKYLQ